MNFNRIKIGKDTIFVTSGRFKIYYEVNGFLSLKRLSQTDSLSI